MNYLILGIPYRFLNGRLVKAADQLNLFGGADPVKDKKRGKNDGKRRVSPKTGVQQELKGGRWNNVEDAPAPASVGGIAVIEQEKPKEESADTDLPSLEDLFIDADRIGNKYQTPEEIQAFNNELGDATAKVGEAIDAQLPDRAPEAIDYSGGGSGARRAVVPANAPRPVAPKTKLPSSVARFLKPKSFDEVKPKPKAEEPPTESPQRRPVAPAGEQKKGDREKGERDPDKLIQAGFLKAEKKFRDLGESEPPGDYTKVVYGLAEVMNANGGAVEPLDLSSRWHDPLASIPVSASFEAIKRSIEGTYERNSKMAINSLEYSNPRAYTVYHAEHNAFRDMGDHKAEGIANLEAALKKEGVRKNTKKWKELYAKNEQKFIDVALKNAKTRAAKQIDNLKRESEKDQAEVKKIQDGANYSDRIAKDLESIGAKPELIERAQKIAQTKREQASNLATRYDHIIKMLQDFIDSDRPSPDPEPLTKSLRPRRPLPSAAKQLTHTTVKRIPLTKSVDAPKPRRKLGKAQLSLFDEALHPRDESGKFTAKGRLTSKLKAATPKAVEALGDRAKKLHSQIKAMPLDKLEDYDPEEDWADDHFLSVIGDLSQQLRDGESDDVQGQVDGILDDHETHSPELNAAYEKHLGEFRGAIAQRLDQGEKDYAQAVEDFDQQMVNLIEAVESRDEWEALKPQLGAIAQTAIQNATQKLGGHKAAIKQIKAEINGIYKSYIKEYDSQEWDE